MAREAGLSAQDMENMNVGDVLTFVYEWVEFHKTEKEEPVREATKEDLRAMGYL